MFKSLFISFIVLILSLPTFAQLDGVKQEDVMLEDNVFLDGVTSDYYSGKAIPGINITAVADGKIIASGTSDGKGEYKIVLEYDKEYIITFSKPGFITKKIVMNTFGVPDKRKQKVPDMVAEITMVQPNDCIKAEMLDKPIGRAKYFPKKNVIDWDMAYSMPLLSALNEMLDNCEEEQKQAQEECENAMKNANKLFAKKKWEEAKTNYEKALGVCPDKKEAQERLNLINTELEKKAEIEKQLAEEKARAEAEAKAKAEAEAAAQKAEEERLAKEKAEKEALAKAEAEAKELAKAEAAAKKAEEERLAKEKKEAEALAKKEAELKAKLEKEAAAKKLAEEKAKKEEAEALAKAKEEEQAKLLAQAEAKKRAEKEAKALAEKEAAKKREEEERKAKEKAAELAKKAEEERAANEVVLLETNAKVQEQVAQQEIEEKKPASITPPTQETNSGTISGSSSIKIKKKNKGRHLYEKPNKPNKGKGPTLKKRMVF